ncbi:DUF4198 domain-containing protein [bacterium]|nr:DUF4198 domain-containing protein [bacterium]
MRKFLFWKIVCGIFFSFVTFSFAHFGMVIPSSDIVEERSKAGISLKVMFAHPFEGETMEMAKPSEFGVYFRGKKINLINQLQKRIYKMYSDKKGHTGWFLNYRLKRPGDYIFYCKPQPYWEEAEDKYIVHYTKVIVNGFGLQDSWDKEIGLKAEIIPLTRPYGIYTGNTFRGLVKINGKVSPFCEVEVEYYNKDGKVKPPYECFITQVIKTDANGIFTYSFPKAGWWGFAALGEDTKKLPYKGKMKEVEIGAVLWVKVYDMK